MKTTKDILQCTTLIVLGIGLLASCKKDKTDKDEINTVTDVDGNKYKTVKIGEQVWMAENLRTTKYNDGIPIQYITDGASWAALTAGAWCYYNNEPANDNPYGKLYNWAAAGTGKLCPTGWHIPTGQDWTKLIDELDGEEVAGGKMKATSLWASPNTGATNESGFTGLPGGIRNTEGAFINIGSYGVWWSSAIYSDYRVSYYLSNNSQVSMDPWANRMAGRSRRCVKD